MNGSKPLMTGSAVFIKVVLISVKVYFAGEVFVVKYRIETALNFREKH